MEFKVTSCKFDSKLNDVPELQIKLEQMYENGWELVKMFEPTEPKYTKELYCKLVFKRPKQL